MPCRLSTFVNRSRQVCYPLCRRTPKAALFEGLITDPLSQPMVAVEEASLPPVHITQGIWLAVLVPYLYPPVVPCLRLQLWTTIRNIHRVFRTLPVHCPRCLGRHFSAARGHLQQVSGKRSASRLFDHLAASTRARASLCHRRWDDRGSRIEAQWVCHSWPVRHARGTTALIRNTAAKTESNFGIRHGPFVARNDKYPRILRLGLAESLEILLARRVVNRVHPCQFLVSLWFLSELLQDSGHSIMSGWILIHCGKACP